MLILGLTLIGCGNEIERIPEDVVVYENMSFSQLMERSRSCDSNGAMFGRFNRTMRFYNTPAADGRTFYIANAGLGPGINGEATVGAVWQVLNESQNADGSWSGQIRISRLGVNAHQGYNFDFTLRGGLYLDVSNLDRDTFPNVNWGTAQNPDNRPGPTDLNLPMGTWVWGIAPVFRP